MARNEVARGARLMTLYGGAVALGLYIIRSIPNGHGQYVTVPIVVTAAVGVFFSLGGGAMCLSLLAGWWKK